MLASAELAAEAEPHILIARLRLFECLLYCGRVDKVRDGLGDLEQHAADHHPLWCRIAEFHTHCADHEAALRCYQRAVALQPDNPEYLYALSAAEIATGDLEAAESHLTDVIRLNPHDYDAYRNRATLKKQTRDDNHIREIEALLATGTKTPVGEVQLCYALAKEYEDLGDDEQSFTWLQRGAEKRRSLLDYRVEGDVAALARLRRVFNSELMNSGAKGCDDVGPVFVMGLPRSGTTLVDRILSSHPDVASLGEINDFAYALMHTIGNRADKLELIDLSTQIDFAKLGRRYVDSIRRYGRQEKFLIDKTPLNYLYIGLIKLALPNARIVHIERNPMDSCYGMYRSLFRAGYPFSYDLADLGKYYLAYRQLMAHWHDVVPGGIHSVRYEELVDDQESVSREIVSYCGLEWAPACLEFHKNESAISTASSAQVRRPVYRDALQRWRRYEEQLKPLAEDLRREGVVIDAA